MVELKGINAPGYGMENYIDAHIEWMEYEQFAQSTRDSRARLLHHAHTHLPRGLDAYPAEIARYLTNPRWSDWTRHTYDAHLRGFYAWWYYEGGITYDPMVEVRVQPRGQFLPKPLTAMELTLALRRSAEPWFTCILLGVGAGLRASEMADLRREDITDEYLHVRNGKGGKARLVDTCGAIWLHLRDRPSGPILCRPRPPWLPVTGQWLSARQVAHWRKIGLPQIHLHRLRHTFATVIFDADIDSLVVRDLLGHASVATTQGYALVSGRNRRRAIGAVDALLGDLIGSGAPAGSGPAGAARGHSMTP